MAESAGSFCDYAPTAKFSSSEQASPTFRFVRHLGGGYLRDLSNAYVVLAVSDLLCIDDLRDHLEDKKLFLDSRYERFVFGHKHIFYRAEVLGVVTSAYCFKDDAFNVLIDDATDVIHCRFWKKHLLYSLHWSFEELKEKVVVGTTVRLRGYLSRFKTGDMVGKITLNVDFEPEILPASEVARLEEEHRRFQVKNYKTFYMVVQIPSEKSYSTALA